MHVVFVCASNRFLSPVAARIFATLATQQKLTLTADSAATLPTHAGKPAEDVAVRVARVRGVELADHVARKIGAEDFTKADLIVALDRSDLRLLTMERPRGCRTEIRLLSSFRDGDGPADIAEPKGDDGERYAAAYEAVEGGVRNLFADLRMRLAEAKVDA